MGSHLAKLGHNPTDVLLRIDEDENNGQFTPGLNQMGGVHFTAPEKSGHGVKHDRAEHVLLPQVFHNLQMQRAMVPGVAWPLMPSIAASPPWATTCVE